MADQEFWIVTASGKKIGLIKAKSPEDACERVIKGGMAGNEWPKRWSYVPKEDGGS